MPTINSIEANYRLYLSRISKQSTRKEYTMRFIDTANGLGLARLNSNNNYNVDNIHHTALGGYNFAQAIWSQLKNIPLFFTAIPS